jgi:hypothetical protein
MASERNSLAIDRYQAVRSLSPLGRPDSRATFLAVKKLASANTSSQSRMPLWSNFERKARHLSLRTSVSYHSLSRRQQIEACGHRSGRSFHRAPLSSTHGIPSHTNRRPALERPSFGPTDTLGNKKGRFPATGHPSDTRPVHSPHLPPAGQIYTMFWKNKHLKHARCRARNLHQRFCGRS